MPTSGTFAVIVAGRLAPVAPRGGLLSSAILYVAIVVIWAGVLIPRWLRRDTSAATVVSEQESEAEGPAEESGRAEDTAGTETGERPGPSSRDRRRRPAGTSGAERRPTAPPARDRDRDRARMLSARRRLLGLLVLLAIASGALAERRLAAWWVVLPPVVMLLGYLGLLREASKADAERLRAIRSRTARDQAAAVRSGPTPAGAAVADVAEVIEISATWEQVEVDELYDQVADAKRRAVGD